MITPDSKMSYRSSPPLPPLAACRACTGVGNAANKRKLEPGRPDERCIRLDSSLNKLGSQLPKRYDVGSGALVVSSTRDRASYVSVQPLRGYAKRLPSLLRMHAGEAERKRGSWGYSKGRAEVGSMRRKLEEEGEEEEKENEDEEKKEEKEEEYEDEEDEEEETRAKGIR